MSDSSVTLLDEGGLLCEFCMNPIPAMTNEQETVRFRGAFVLLLTLFISWVFIEMIRPFLMALLMAAICAGMVGPIYRGLKRLFRERQVPAALVTVFVLFFLIVGPMTAFVGVVVGQAIDVSQSAIPWVKAYVNNDENLLAMEDWFQERFPALVEYLPDQSQLVESVGTAAESLGEFLVKSLSKMTAGTAAFLMNLFVMHYALFFFLIKGDALLEKIFHYSPLSREEEKGLTDKFLSVTRATIKGSLVIGIIQGGLCGMAFAIGGITGAAFWGTIMAVLSVIPGIGTSLVWVPTTIFLAANGEWTKALLLAAWCGAIVGNIDNLLRPRLVGQDTKMPDLLILLGTLGGIFMFGAIGFIIGPIICSLFVAIWEIYGGTFRSYLPIAPEGKEGGLAVETREEPSSSPQPS